MLKTGMLTAAGAKRLGVAHLAQSQVDYEPRYHARLGKYAGDIYHQGTRLGSTMILGEDGILPCREETKKTEHTEECS